ncbi:hypothetical protein FS749_009830, partial [Ceratobasidium sp. UAMH 11750]
MRTKTKNSDVVKSLVVENASSTAGDNLVSSTVAVSITVEASTSRKRSAQDLSSTTDADETRPAKLAKQGS